MKDNIFSFIKKKIRKKIQYSEFYKSEMPEHIEAFISSVKSTIIFSFAIVIITKNLNIPYFHILASFLITLFFWKICQTSQKAWAKLNKLHTIIKDEQFEIEHHRPRERKELEVLYKAKGLTGKLLEDVLDVLMSDDNRLLQVMMEEEMGLVLKRYEHPLKQGFFAGLGVLIPSVILLLSIFYADSYYEYFIIGAFINMIISTISYKAYKTNFSFVIVWNLAILAIVSITCFFASNFIKTL